MASKRRLKRFTDEDHEDGVDVTIPTVANEQSPTMTRNISNCDVVPSAVSNKSVSAQVQRRSGRRRKAVVRLVTDHPIKRSKPTHLSVVNDDNNDDDEVDWVGIRERKRPIRGQDYKDDGFLAPEGVVQVYTAEEYNPKANEKSVVNADYEEEHGEDEQQEIEDEKDDDDDGSEDEDDNDEDDTNEEKRTAKCRTPITRDEAFRRYIIYLTAAMVDPSAPGGIYNVDNKTKSCQELRTGYEEAFHKLTYDFDCLRNKVQSEAWNYAFIYQLHHKAFIKHESDSKTTIACEVCNRVEDRGTDKITFYGDDYNSAKFDYKLLDMPTASTSENVTFAIGAKCLKRVFLCHNMIHFRVRTAMYIKTVLMHGQIYFDYQTISEACAEPMQDIKEARLKNFNDLCAYALKYADTSDDESVGGVTLDNIKATLGSPTDDSCQMSDILDTSSTLTSSHKADDQSRDVTSAQWGTIDQTESVTNGEPTNHISPPVAAAMRVIMALSIRHRAELLQLLSHNTRVTFSA